MGRRHIIAALVIGLSIIVIAFRGVGNWYGPGPVATTELPGPTGVPPVSVVSSLPVVYDDWEIGGVKQCLLSGMLAFTKSGGVITLPPEWEVNLPHPVPYLWCPGQLAFDVARKKEEGDRLGVIYRPNPRILNVKLLNEGNPAVLPGVDGRDWSHCRRTVEVIECQ